MKKQTVLETVSLQPGGGVTVRLRKQLIEDDDVFRDDPHMFVASGDKDVEANLSDLDAYLTLNKWPTVSAEDRAFILGQAGSAAVVQARAAASDFAQAARTEAENAAAEKIAEANAAADAVKAEAEKAVTAAQEETTRLVDEANEKVAAAEERASEAEERVAALEAAHEADMRHTEPVA